MADRRVLSRNFTSILQRGSSKARVLAQFFSAQALTMAGNLLYGLLCVRLLQPADYAKFVVLFGVQGTIIVLMDVNFSGSLIPLIGERVNDRKLIANYVASLRQLSYWTYVLVGLGLVFAYPLMVKNRGWSWQTITAMVITLLVSTWFMRIGSAYGAVLILLRARPAWYQGQLISSLGTLALLVFFWGVGWLSSFSAILINVSGIIFVGIFYFHLARRKLGTEGTGSPEKRTAIIRLALPNVPQAIFYALQGQLSLFLITFWGHTKGVASVGALARLGQIFSIFMQLNPLVIEPYFAKLPKQAVKRSYQITLLLAGLTCTAVALAASAFPELFLRILGSQYSGLHSEVKLAIAASAVSCFSSVLWCIHLARRFVYWWNVILSIGLTIAVQILCVLKLDMGTVRGVLLLSLATNLASLLINVLSGAYGFWKGPREVEAAAKGSVAAEASIAMDPLEFGTASDDSLTRDTPGLVVQSSTTNT